MIMSSNAFARSRPRARHQRVPRTHSCDHPRFIQLVNELVRINEAKRKQEEADGNGGGGGSGGLSSGPVTAECSGEADNGGGSSSNAVQLTCCNAGLVAQTSNGYRSLDNNQSTSTLHDNYYQHSHNHQNHHNNSNHHHHNHHHNHNHHHHDQQEQEPQHLGNSNLHQDDRCPGKCSSSTSNTTSFGYSKQNLVVEQTNSDFSNNNLDLRQDENRSKRKRSANDSSSNSKKNSLSSCTGTTKRHKSSPDIRPLSPSFTKCPICLLDSMDRDPSFTNTCFHLFCYVCIENWTKSKATCPLCRTKFTKIIYNIKSATNYEEKTASPIRREDDDVYMTDRLMLEHLSGFNSNSTVSSRSNNEDVQFIFENLRNSNEGLMAPLHFVNQIDPRQGESLHSFNSVTTSTNFNSNVPHPPYTPTYPIAQNYVALFPPNRIPSTTSTAITSAYTANTSITNINNDPGSRRISRSGRYIYTRSIHEPPAIDGSSSRVSRASSTNINQPGIVIERHHHHPHQHQHPHQNHHQHHHPHNQHRSTLDMSPRQNQRIEQTHAHIQLPYTIQPRHYNPNAYARRPYNNSQVEHHLLDTLYRQLPDMQ